MLLSTSDTKSTCKANFPNFTLILAEEQENRVFLFSLDMKLQMKKAEHLLWFLIFCWQIVVEVI